MRHGTIVKHMLSANAIITPQSLFSSQFKALHLMFYAPIRSKSVQYVERRVQKKRKTKIATYILSEDVFTFRSPFTISHFYPFRGSPLNLRTGKTMPSTYPGKRSFSGALYGLSLFTFAIPGLVCTILGAIEVFKHNHHDKIAIAHLFVVC